MVVVPTNMPTDDFRTMADHRRQRNITRLIGLTRRTSITPHNHQSGTTSLEMAEENTESSMPRVKKKIKHKWMWDEPEAQASEVLNTTSKRPDRIKTRRRLVVPSSSTARSLRTAVIQEDPYYDFGKKIKHASSSTVGLQNILDSEGKTSMKSPIIVSSSEEDGGTKHTEAARDKLVTEPAPHNTTTAPRTRTANRNHNSTSNNNPRRYENLTECAYPIARFSRRNNKSRSQREAVRCSPIAAESDLRTTRILSTVVTSVSSVKGTQRKNDTPVEPGLEMAAVTTRVAPDYASTVFQSFGATSEQQFSSTVKNPVAPTVPAAHPKQLRSRYRNISLPEYLEITKVNQRRLNVSTEAVISTAITPSTVASSFLPSVDNTEIAEVMPMTSDKSLQTTTNIPSSSGPPSDIQDFIYLSNGTSESPVDTSAPTDVNEAVGARQRRPPPSLQRNITRLSSNAEHDVGVVYSEGLATSTYLLSLLAIVPLVIVIVFAFCKLAVRRKKKKVFDSSEYSSEYNRSPLDFNTITSSPITTKLPRVPQHIVWDVGAASEKTPQSPPPPPPITSLPSNSRWEFRREKLRLQTILGQGNFGQVWKAEADDISGHEGLTRLVAVKMVKEDAATREREDLIRELSIMQHLGSHQNVVTLLGCCTEKGMHSNTTSISRVIFFFSLIQ